MDKANVDVSKFSKASFMDQVAFVFQDGGILNGSILDNIRYGDPNASDDACIKVYIYIYRHDLTSSVII